MRIAIVDDLAAERALLKDRLERQLQRRNVQADIHFIAQAAAGRERSSRQEEADSRCAKHPRHRRC